MATNPSDPAPGRDLTYAADDARGITELQDALDAASRDRIKSLARQHAQTSGASHRPAHNVAQRDHLRQMGAFLRRATALLRAKPPQEPLSYAAEWMLDNFHLVEQSLREASEELPAHYYRELPELVSGPSQGYPRIYDVAQDLVAASGGHLELDRIARLMQLYQDVTPLGIGELWALPAMLRLAILELLCQSLARITGLERRDALLPASPPAFNDAEIVPNCIMSLQTLQTQDWQLFFESISQVEHVLREDPAHVYASMDRETRDRYRKAVETMARRTGHAERRVARQAIGLAQAHAPENGSPADGLRAPRARHVGYYLLDAGRSQLEVQLGYRIGWQEGWRRWILKHPTLVYVGSIAFFAVLVLVAGAGYVTRAGGDPGQVLAACLLLLIPGLTASVSVMNWLLTLLVPPRVLPKMDFKDGLPEECKTLVVIPSLLTDRTEVNSLLQQLELHFIRNQDPHLHFALLTDLADSPRRHGPEGEHLVEQAAAGIRALNEKYPRATPGPFYLFHRDPTWNPREERWMGWERKRGKLHQLNLLLRGGAETAFSVQTGDAAALREIRYVITLDSDTVMPRDAAERLIATLAHPLNRAELDPHSGTVVAGYTVLQPGIEISTTSANLSRFTRIFAGDVGLDLYTRAVSDIYQDLFGEGIYVGKGIYDVDAFERSLAGRMPENALLSHDLLEGLMGRVALVTDVVFYEDYPPHYFVYIRRSRRWIRGDWQLLPWLFPRVPSIGKGSLPNHLSIIDRWKILDNLRRSLLEPALVGLLLAGWLWLPGSPLIWTLAALLTPAVPMLTGLLVGSIKVLQRGSWQGVWQGPKNGIGRWLLALAFLLYETLLTLGGITTTLVRLLVTRKRLLEWTSYADTVRLFAGGITWRQMSATILSSTGLALLVALLRPAALPVAAPLLLAWLLSPQIAYWISRPIRFVPGSLSAEERHRLRRLARRTWLFFEQFVGPEDHWLPPDHFQEAPRGIVAHSTSPTDLGLLLLSSLAAYDLGYIGLGDISARLQSTFESMAGLETYQGHLLNWYDTRTLEPLLPRYVSTVDSGNLAAALRTLCQACQELSAQPVLRWQSWEGLLDTLSLLEATVDELHTGKLKQAGLPLRAQLAQMRQQVLAARDQPGEWIPLLSRLSGEGWAALSRILISLAESGGSELSPRALRELSHSADRVQNHLHSMRREIQQLAPWLTAWSDLPAFFREPGLPSQLQVVWNAMRDALPDAPQLNELGQACQIGMTLVAELQDQLDEQDDKRANVRLAREWCTQFAQGLASAATSADALLTSFQDINASCKQYIEAMNFRFLFNRQRQLFHIGYNVTAARLDSNYYDLLASEARIASLMTIAENQVPQSHWLHLGRPLTEFDGMRSLLSWGGTMFEYLMPALLIRTYEGTFLQQSGLAAVETQIAYGRDKNTPWGISESGYYDFDANQNYQYRSFGVPRLALKRGLEQDLVVAPYASLLALRLRPRKVIENLARLVKMQVLGTYGLYESVDFTPGRLPPGQTYAVVRSYMAHHQAMILLSLLNYLHDNAMVRRFHADAHVRSVELLLQERVPAEAPLEAPPPADERGSRRGAVHRQNIAAPWQAPVHARVPHVHVLSNRRYGVLITSAGGGYSSWHAEDGAAGIDLTRWRADSTRDDWGTWIYVQDMDAGEVWSAAFQPTASPPESGNVQFYPHMAQFRRSDHDIGLTMEIAVAPDDDVEIRRVSLTNQTDQVRHIALVSYAEVILTQQSADASHPAFNKMFVESEYVPEANALLFRRRPRLQDEEPVYLVHAATVSPAHQHRPTYETDRARFLGRGRTLRAPAALDQRGAGLTGSTGATLDPIMSLRLVLQLEPHASAQASFITLAARSREKALDLAHRYKGGHLVMRTFDLARVRAEEEMHQRSMASTDLEQIQRLLSVLIYPDDSLRADADTLAANRKGQSGLWPFGISGDFPILLVRVDEAGDLTLLREALRAHRYWRDRHISIDLVVLDQQGSTYGQELRGQLQRLLVEQNSENWLNRRGGIFILYGDQLGEFDRVLLGTAARVVLDGARGSLAQQLQALNDQRTTLPPMIPSPPDVKETSTPRLERPDDLLFDNGLGGFSADGREYVVYLEPGQWTPAPWVNVISNPVLGFTVSESGSGFTWSLNSHENRLTPWTNDPVMDPPGEAIYLRDEETAEVWSPTPLPCGAPAPYLIRHGTGQSVFEHNSHGLKQQLTFLAAHDAPVKVLRLRLENTWRHTRRLTATFYAEWVLGVARDKTQQYVVSEFDPEHQVLLARNTYNEEFASRVAFAAASKTLHGLTADRTEFFGRFGDLTHPAALERIGLASAVEPGADPCAALQLHLDLEPGAAEEVFFLLGQGADREEALRLVEHYRAKGQVERAGKQVTEFWDDLLGAVQVQTPDPAMDLLLNRWLVYATLSCRVWGRSALYQSSGAFGFRDQLQDVMALIHAAPGIARDQILQSAQHQFEAGDVLHWWHPPSARGVRTRSSDDLLWLPFCTAHYVSATGDASILNESLPFRKGAPLGPAEAERYDQYPAGDEAYTLYEHCRRALERGTTAGVHGLPLMGSGDWNDGMNLVGIHGRGESVWVGWFLGATLMRFAELCESRGDERQAAIYRQRAAELGKAIETNAWDGAWYRRAYYDDGAPLGSSTNDECQIDSIAQSWSVLSGLGDAAHVRLAMRSVTERLLRPADEILLLLAPPFDRTLHDPGYIKGYPPGIRENGGQYTHGSLWSVLAFAELGEGDQAGALFDTLNPIHHSNSPAAATRYRVEPYVVAADIYSTPPHTGRGGWTWYTGSNGWMYRAGLEAILGIRRTGKSLVVDPCIPRAWPNYQVTYRVGHTVFHIRVDNAAGVSRGIQQVSLDGKALPGNAIPLLDDDETHEVHVLLGHQTA